MAINNDCRVGIAPPLERLVKVPEPQPASLLEDAPQLALNITA
jgi:hypothetical protein